MKSAREPLQKNTGHDVQGLVACNNFKVLINQIVEQTNERDKKELAALVCIKGRTLNFSTTDLHCLLNKRNDPSIRNYTGFVKWSFGLSKKKTGSNPGLVSGGK